jgi:hypothetical protein
VTAREAISGRSSNRARLRTGRPARETIASGQVQALSPSTEADAVSPRRADQGRRVEPLLAHDLTEQRLDTMRREFVANVSPSCEHSPIRALTETIENNTSMLRCRSSRAASAQVTRLTTPSTSCWAFRASNQGDHADAQSGWCLRTRCADLGVPSAYKAAATSDVSATTRSPSRAEPRPSFRSPRQRDQGSPGGAVGRNRGQERRVAIRDEGGHSPGNGHAFSSDSIRVTGRGRAPESGSGWRRGFWSGDNGGVESTNRQAPLHVAIAAAIRFPGGRRLR